MRSPLALVLSLVGAAVLAAPAPWPRPLRLNYRLPHTLEGHTGFVLGLAFSPDGKILASGDAEKMIILWNVSPTGPK